MKANKIGFFYLAQLYPDLMPSLLKGGFSKSPGRRASDYRTTAPDVKILCTFQATEYDEKQVLSRLAQAGTSVGGEVVLCDATTAEEICHSYFKENHDHDYS